jgi:hypothetical protein
MLKEGDMLSVRLPLCRRRRRRAIAGLSGRVDGEPGSVASKSVTSTVKVYVFPEAAGKGVPVMGTKGELPAGWLRFSPGGSAPLVRTAW